jgi:ABC-type transport system substrate-binding protein
MRYATSNSGGALKSPRAWFLRAVAVAIAAATTLAVGGCAPAPSTSGSSSVVGNETLTIGLSAEIASLPAGADKGSAGTMVHTLVNRGLMAYDNKGVLVPGLAASVETPDPTTYTFRLRPDLKFSDGSVITAATVKATLDYLRNPASAARIFSGAKDIAGITEVDDKTVKVTLKGPDSAFLEYLADPTAGIVPPAALKPGEPNWIGAGPFKLDEYVKGVKAVFSRNEHFYENTSQKLNKVNVAFYPDGQARVNALMSGEVDLIDYVPWEDFDRIEKTKGLTLDSQNGPFQFVVFNVTKGPMADPLVRQAVAHAINRDNVVAGALSGHGTPLYGMPVDASNAAFDPAWNEMWGYDPAKAKKLLAEAGYPNGFDVTLLTSAQYAFHQDTALAVQSDLKAVGINVKLDNPDWATRVKQGNEGSYEFAVNGNSGLVTDLSYINSFVSGPPSQNRSFGYDNADLNGILEGALRATDPAAKKELYGKARQIMTAEVPNLPLALRGQAFAYNSGRVHGFKNFPGFLTFYSFYSLVGTTAGNQQ